MSNTAVEILNDGDQDLAWLLGQQRDRATGRYTFARRNGHRRVVWPTGAGRKQRWATARPPAPMNPHQRLGHAVVPMRMIPVILAVNSVCCLVRLRPTK